MDIATCIGFLNFLLSVENIAMYLFCWVMSDVYEKCLIDVVWDKYYDFVFDHCDEGRTYWYCMETKGLTTLSYWMYFFSYSFCVTNFAIYHVYREDINYAIVKLLVSRGIPLKDLQELYGWYSKARVIFVSFLLWQLYSLYSKFTKYPLLPLAITFYVFLMLFFCVTKREWWRYLLGIFTPTKRRIEHDPVVLAFAATSAKYPGVVDIEGFAREVAKGCNMDLYHYGYGRNDNIDFGQNKHYWARNTLHGERCDYILGNHIIYMRDVDYYVNMNTFMLEHTNPILLYNIQPRDVAYSGKNYKYTFKENKMWFIEEFGEQFLHEVWNYNGNFITVKEYFMGIPWKGKTYSIRRHIVDQHRMFILLTPIARWYGTRPSSFGVDFTDSPLLRFMPSDSGFVRLSYWEGKNFKTSTTISGHFEASNVDREQDELVYNIACASTHLTNSMIRDKLKIDYQTALRLFLYHRARGAQPLPIYIVPSHAIHSYEFNTEHDDSKATLVAHCNAFDNNCYAPVDSLQNERESIRVRVDDVRSPILKITPKFKKRVLKFVELLVHEYKNSCMMEDDDMVYERQAKINQRIILERAHHLDSNMIVSAFLKKEALQEPKAPRNISTINPHDKLWYSRVIYGFERVMKQHSWYAFSKTMDKIERRVAHVLNGRKTAINTDFSKFDGRLSNRFRYLEQEALRYAFLPEEVEIVLKLHATQRDCAGFGRHDTQYDTGTGRLSGSPETSVFNSLDNAFVSFSTYCEMGLADQEAFNKLGIYGGDDGLSPEMDAKIFTREAGEMGQKVTVEEIKHGFVGIKFLAHVYGPQVWYGEVNGMSEPKRQMSKLHSAVKIDPRVPLKIKFLEKIRAYSLSDWNTPILGDIIQRVYAINGDISFDERCRPMLSWLGTMDKEHQYTNFREEWMYDWVYDNYDEFDYAGLLKFLSECKTVEEIMATPCFCPNSDIKRAANLMINGESHTSDDDLSPINSPKDNDNPNNSPTSSTTSSKDVKREIFEDEKSEKSNSSKESFDEYKERHKNDPKFIDPKIWMSMTPEARRLARSARKNGTAKPP